MAPADTPNGSASPRNSARPGRSNPAIANSPFEAMTGSSANRPFQSNCSARRVRAVRWKAPPSVVVRKSCSEKPTCSKRRSSGVRRARSTYSTSPPPTTSDWIQTAGRGSSGSTGVPGSGGITRSPRFTDPSGRTTVRMCGAPMSKFLKTYERRQSEATSKSTNNRSKPSIGAPSASGRRSSRISSCSVNGLKRISPSASSRP